LPDESAGYQAVDAGADLDRSEGEVSARGVQGAETGLGVGASVGVGQGRDRHHGDSSINRRSIFAYPGVSTVVRRRRGPPANQSRPASGPAAATTRLHPINGRLAAVFRPPVGPEPARRAALSRTRRGAATWAAHRE